MEPISTAAVIAPTTTELGTAVSFLFGLLPISIAAIVTNVALIVLALVVVATGLLPIVRFIVSKTETRKDDEIFNKVMNFVGNPVTRAVWVTLKKFAIDFAKENPEKVIKR